MVRTLVTPILSGLTREQIEEGASFLYGEISLLRDEGLIKLTGAYAFNNELGPVENRQAGPGDSDRSDRNGQDALGEIPGRGPREAL